MDDITDQALPSGESLDGNASQQMALQTVPPPPSEQAPSTALEFERLQLLSRFLIGALAFGGDGARNRLKELQRRYDTDPSPPTYDDSLEGESTAALLSYTTIGLILHGQRRVARSIRTGYYASLGAASWLSEKFSGAASNSLTRPLARPIQTRLARLSRQMDALAREGKLETQLGRRLTADALGEIIDDFVDLIAESPELTQYVQQILGQQGAGLASTVGGNARQLTARGDYVVEGVVRRILRRPSRRELPPSPLAGVPQTMYDPGTQEWGREQHDE